MELKLKRFPAPGILRRLKRPHLILGGIVLVLMLLPSFSRAGSSSNTPSGKADSVLIKKSQRRLYLMKDGKPFRDFRIALGKDPLGAKLFEGDNKTPEGDYILDWRNSESDFYKSIHISYPNKEDLAFARFIGNYPGGNIMIHGIPDKPDYPDWLYVEFDWTDGCIAVTNEAMDEIWGSVEEGTPIRILP